MNGISGVFDLLDRWRHLPCYQLERRADIFFALYLPAFLSQRFKMPIRPTLIPEFPIRHGTIGQDHENRSCKVDYLALAENSSAAFLIELKTDGESRRTEQDEYLVRARTVGLRALLEGVVALARASNAKRKYCYLLKELEGLGLIALPPALTQRRADEHQRGLGLELENVRVVAGEIPVKVVYLQPRATTDDEIGFDAFAESLRPLNDALSVRFRQSLLEWHARGAGACGWAVDAPRT